jgi:hypothetical protein
MINDAPLISLFKKNESLFFRLPGFATAEEYARERKQNLPTHFAA